MTTTPPGSRTSALMSLRMTAGALITAPIILGVMVWFILPERQAPPAWSVAAAVGLVVVGFGLAHMLGYPTSRSSGPGPRDIEDTGRAAAQAFHSSLFLRFALAEGPLLLSFVLAFAIMSPIPYFAALPFGVLSMAWHVWPSESLINRWQAKYEQNGQPSYLREALGASHHSGGLHG